MAIAEAIEKFKCDPRHLFERFLGALLINVSDQRLRIGICNLAATRKIDPTEKSACPSNFAEPICRIVFLHKPLPA